MSLEGKGVVVTGAASGIGRATALHLAAEGARVVVSDVSEAEGQETVDAITSTGGTAAFVRCDVSDEGDVEELFARAVKFLGGLDCAVNNAGIGHAPIDLHEMSVETWDQLISIDLRGVFLCMRAELKVMSEAGSGSIVNMASGAGVKNAPNMPAYTAAKHGVVGLTKNAALQYATRGIRVNAICPGTILTPGMSAFPAEARAEWAAMVPMKRLGTPEEVAEAISFLLGDKSGFITGVPLVIDGGIMYAD